MNNLPTNKPGSQAFMVFSMLLLGTFSAVLVIIFDLFQSDKTTISSVIIKHVKEFDGVPYITIISITGLSLLAVGFFIYLSSFIILSLPAMLLRNIVKNWKNGLFAYITTNELKEITTEVFSENTDRKFRDAFLYIYLTSEVSENSSNIRFAFTQLMFGRSLCCIFLIFSVYACLVSASYLGIWILIIPILFYALCIAWYIYGLDYYEDIMTCGYLVNKSKLCKKTVESI
jgi:hypothetical protein